MRLAVLLAALVLAGCATNRVGLGGADEVLFSSQDTIKLQWDELFTNEAAVRQKALAHCGGRDIEEIDATRDASTFGLIRSKTWRCVSPTR